MQKLSDGERDILAEQERDARPGPITPRDVFDALDELGGTADIVAARLLAEGCRGRRMKGESCPVANYLKMMFDLGAAVCAQSACLWSGPECDLPPAVASFVSRFDAGEFPDLETHPCPDR